MNFGSITGLFPLNLVVSGLDNYYINKTGDIYSTKTKITPQLLCGSGRGMNRSFTLSGASRHARAYNNGQLFRQAKQHHAWAKETGANPERADKPDSITLSTLGVARDHASTTASGIKAKGYIIGKVEGEAIVFGSKPMIHTSLTSVKSEVARLAEKSPGVQIIYVKIEGAATAKSIAWE